MTDRVVLEICVPSVEHAMAAERGGADRIELCADLPLGGTTPSAGLIEMTRRSTKIPVHVLIRPRAGNFFYSAHEFEIMQRDICTARELGADAIVLGLLDEDKNIDVERTRALVEFAHPLPVTFHRAFDQCADHPSSLERVIRTGVERILTAGGSARAAENVGRLEALITAAGDRVTVMPGGGIGLGNVQGILRRTAATEIHSSLGASSLSPVRKSANAGAKVYPNDGIEEFENRVRRLRELAESAAAG